VVRHEILDVRVYVSGQHSVADLLDEQVFRGRVHQVRFPSDRHVRRTPGQQGRPNGVHISPGDEMHVPQVRPVWDHTETRLAVRATAEHYQREDLHSHMVLVSTAVDRACPNGRLQVFRTILSIRTNEREEIRKENTYTVLRYVRTWFTGHKV